MKLSEKEFAIENDNLMKDIANRIKRSKLPRGQVIGILEILKTEIIMNGGCVIVDGKELNVIEELNSKEEKKLRKKK